MNMNAKSLPIGVFDSGLGGISVLRELVRVMPNEDFVFFGDSKNAPYGTRPTAEVKQLSYDVVAHLRQVPVKAIVIACNTATSAAAQALRADYSLPIIGIEPALKPAVLNYPGGEVVVLATELTLREEKFHQQLMKYDTTANIHPVPAPQLVEYVERGEIDSPAVRHYLQTLLQPFKQIDAVVLGCTHYPFVKGALRKLLGPTTALIDGGLGTAKETKRQLQKHDLVNDENHVGSVKFENSNADPEEITLSKRLFNLPEE